MTRWPVDRHDRGFTLVEVLVAFAVTALLLTFLLTAATTARRRQSLAAEQKTAALIARSVIEQVAAKPFDADGEDGNEAGLRWRIGESVLLSARNTPVALVAMTLDVETPNGRHLLRAETRKFMSVGQ